MRFIGGVKAGNGLFALNPILGVPLSKSIDGSAGVDFNLAAKASRQWWKGFAVRLEHYAEAGNVKHINFGRNSAETTYLAFDVEIKGWDINFGVGHGGTSPADKLVFKMILGVPF